MKTSNACWPLVVGAMMVLLLPYALCEDYELVAGRAGGVSVIVDTTNGNYTIKLDSFNWFRSGATAIHTQSGWFASGLSDSHQLGDRVAPLKLISSKKEKGDDIYGPYESLMLNWTTGGSNPIAYGTEFKVYNDVSAIIFLQHFPNGLKSASVGSNTDVISSFPSFSSHYDETLHYLTYFGNMARGSVGLWPSSDYPGGIEGGSPLALYNKHLRTVVIAPWLNVMVGSQTLSSSLGFDFVAGLQGKIDNIPAGWTHGTLLYAGQGVASTFQEWGSLLLQRSGKLPTPQTADLIIQYLGYWTDNGAYYYYNTEPGKNYQVTIGDVAKYIDSIGLPVQYYQFDSWWYFKGLNDGLKLWEPRPDIFPGGMDAVAKQLGYPPLILHNRYFASNNDYEKSYNFITEKDIALPIDQRMFEHIMGIAKRWGMAVYEQDWLISTYTRMECTQNNLTNAYEWLSAMANAARNLGVTIQYCMPLPLHILASVDFPAVTQARASDDYETATNDDQWRIGYTSLFYWSVGLIPYKDDFWSHDGMQTGCPYKDRCYEPNPEMETLIAALSSGPVGPADKIGFLNTTRLMQTCRADGLLLKADRPAIPVDSVFSSQFNGNKKPIMLEIWESSSTYGSMSWHYIFSANISNPFTLRPADLGLPSSGRYVVYNYHKQPLKFSTFSQSAPLILPAGTQNPTTKVIPFAYHVVAPVLANNWIFLGEKGKYVAASHQRFKNFDLKQNGLDIIFVGVPGEVVELVVVPPSQQTPVSVKCIIPQFSGGLAKAVCQGTSCTCGAAS